MYVEAEWGMVCGGVSRCMWRLNAVLSVEGSVDAREG